MFKHILLCTHGSKGAQKAEILAFKKLAKDARITVLTVINKDWELMIGDDWLNTSKTQRDFMAHVNNQITSEIQEDWERIKETYPEALDSTFEMEVGVVEEVLVSAAKRVGADLILVGPRQKVRKGFKARIENKTLHPMLEVPLMVAPEQVL